MVHDECYFLPFDTTILKTQVIYHCDSSTIRQIIAFKEGSIDSTFIEFYKNGHVKVKCNYKEGSREGYYISHYEDGKIKCVGVYKMNKFTGSEFKYWDNGTIAELRSYSNGIPPLFGQSKYFNDAGKEIKENEFLNLWLGWKN